MFCDYILSSGRKMPRTFAFKIAFRAEMSTIPANIWVSKQPFRGFYRSLVKLLESLYEAELLEIQAHYECLIQQHL